MASLAGAAFPQGQLVYNNRVNNVVVAPVYGAEPGDGSIAKHGNTPLGIPVGSQVYGGSALTGSGFTAQLFGGSIKALRENLQPLAPAVPFRTGNSSGFIAAPGVSLTVPGVPEGLPAKIILRTWDNRGGTRTNWAQVAGKSDIAKGESWPFVTPPLGGPSFAPPNLIGLESFNLSTGSVWRSGIKINFQTANAPAPVGYRIDYGQQYTVYPDGMAYGWNFDHGMYGSVRNATNSMDPQHDTFIDMQVSSVWEIALSNGLYGVHLSIGDPLRTNSTYRVAAEDNVPFDGTPSFRGRWLEGDELVFINDGRLTLRTSSANTPVCFIEIARLDGPFLRVLTSSSNPNTNLLQLSFTGEVGARYQIQFSPDLTTWSPLGLAANTRADEFTYSDPIETGTASRFYRAAILFP